MSRTKYSVSFPSKRAGAEITWPNTVLVFPDRDARQPLQEAYLENPSSPVLLWSESASVPFSCEGETLTCTRGAPTQTGADAAAGGGGGASEQSTYDSGNGGNGFEATSDVQTNATWSHVTGGALLGLTDPQNPTVLADGLYYVNCQLLADSTPQNDWGVYLGQGSGGDQDRDFGFLPGGSTMGGVAAISVGAVMALHAGDHIWAAVIATETDDDVFYLTARVIKIY